MSELEKHCQDRDEDFLEYDYYGNPTPESIARERELKERTYSTGEFAAKAHVTIRTIRYYDKKDLLKPSYRTESEARRYTDEDFVKLQQILLFKYLGFSLDEIRELTIGALDPENLTQSLRVQKRLIEERVEQMQAMTTAIDRTIGQLQHHTEPDWSSMLNLIHLTSMEQSFKSQYQNATNLSARIRLHRDYSTNPEGWFPWLYRQLDLEGLGQQYHAPKKGAVQLSVERPRVLELGCGSGALWAENIQKVPQSITIQLSDISEGMIRDAKSHINGAYQRQVDALATPRMFEYRQFDCSHIPCEKESVDLVIANHLLFYCGDLNQVLSEVRRVLKPGGRFVTSTYSGRHMREITELVQDFNPDIVLAADNLYEKFGLDNGGEILSHYFGDGNVDRFLYEDAIEINDPEPLISYILSCHGNQNEKLLNKYKEFKEFVEKKVEKGFHITKDAGVFICRKV